MEPKHRHSWLAYRSVISRRPTGEQVAKVGRRCLRCGALSVKRQTIGGKWRGWPGEYEPRFLGPKIITARTIVETAIRYVEEQRLRGHHLSVIIDINRVDKDATLVKVVGGTTHKVS